MYHLSHPTPTTSSWLRLRSRGRRGGGEGDVSLTGSEPASLRLCESVAEIWLVPDDAEEINSVDGAGWGDVGWESGMAGDGEVEGRP